MHRRKRIANRVTLALLLILVAVHLVPVFMVLLNSLRTNNEVNRRLIGWPQEFCFTNYEYVFHRANYLKSYLLNALIGGASVLLVLLVIVMASYGIVKMNAFGSKFFTGYFAAAMSIPTFGILVPLFFAFKKLGLSETVQGIVLIFSATAIPLNFLFMRAFFVGIPSEIEEAARIDGASELQNIWYITIPLAKPIMLTSSLIVFTDTWNNFLLPNIFLSRFPIRVVSLNFFVFEGQFVSRLAYIFTAAMFSILPILVLYFFLQNSFISGMTAGGVKG